MMSESNNNSILEESKKTLKIESLQLPREIENKYASRGISSMFEWQLECLQLPGVLQGKNLVYSAPTSAGKTFVAEILATQALLERKKKVLFVLPFISVVREKLNYFQGLFTDFSLRIDGFMGSYNYGGFEKSDLAVATIEKANSLINRMIENDSLGDLGCVIVDELHLLSDANRGYLLELLLAKICFLSRKSNGIQLQVVGMSATLPNMDILADWLDAQFYTTQFRPVPLTEYIKVGQVMHPVNSHKKPFHLERKITIDDDEGDIVYLCIESIVRGHSTLVFCPTKWMCERLAEKISARIKRVGRQNHEFSGLLRSELRTDDIIDVIEQLKKTPASLDVKLKSTVSFGVAFHHAGLTLEERAIIEMAFCSGSIRVIVATSTLSSGVNLPARRVIIQLVASSAVALQLGPLTYRQMCGRAGRMGIDTEGESILVCGAGEKHVADRLVNHPLPALSSCLGDGNSDSDNNLAPSESLKRALLEVIAAGVVSSNEEAAQYLSHTLFHHLHPTADLKALIGKCVDSLKSDRFICCDRSTNDGCAIWSTALGRASLAASLPPSACTLLLNELNLAIRAFILDTDLHVLYQITPFNVADQWYSLKAETIFSTWESLPEPKKRVGRAVGIQEGFIIATAKGNTFRNANTHASQLKTMRRFVAALALHDLIEEMPLMDVVNKYKCPKGVLQNLQQASSTFAGMVRSFCHQLGWSSVEALVSQFVDRLQFGVRKELVDLLRCPSMTSYAARLLFDAGIRTLVDLANSQQSALYKILSPVTPFSTNDNCKMDGERKTIWLYGREACTNVEAARIIISEARSLLQKDIMWLQKEANSVVNEKSVEIGDVEVEMTKNRNDFAEKKLPVNDVDAPNVSSQSIELFVHSERIKTSLEKSTPTLAPILDETRWNNRKSRSSVATVDLEDEDVWKKWNWQSLASSTPTSRPALALEQDASSCSEEGFESSDYMSGELFVADDCHDLDCNAGAESILELSVTADVDQRVRTGHFNFILAEANHDCDILIDKDDFFETPQIRGNAYGSTSSADQELDLYKSFFNSILSSNASVHDVKTQRVTENQIESVLRRLDEKCFVTLSMKECDRQRRQIGSNIAATGAVTCEYSAKLWHLDNKIVEGFEICSSEKMRYYFDLFELNEENCLRVLRRILKRTNLVVCVYDCQSFYKLATAVLRICPRCRFFDVLIADWIENCGKSARYEKIWNGGKSLPTFQQFWNVTKGYRSQLDEQANAYYLTALKVTNLSNISKEIYVYYKERFVPVKRSHFDLLASIVALETNIAVLLAIIETNGIQKDREKLASNLDELNELINKLQSDKRLHDGLNRAEDNGKALVWHHKRLLTEMRGMAESPGSRICAEWRCFSMTGRIYCRKPSLQMLPKILQGHGIQLYPRSSFSAKKRCALISADYRQMELRILSNMSGDAALRGCFMEGADDPFVTLASHWLRVDRDKVTTELREKGKKLCYGVIYGMGVESLSRQLDCSRAQADGYIRSFHQAFPAICKFIDDLVERCKSSPGAYCCTITGRWRSFTSLLANHSALRRKCVNYTIQGSATDIVKMAMIGIQRRLKESDLHASAALVINMHDELIYEVDEGKVEAIAAILKKEMEHAALLTQPPLQVSLKIGRNWSSLEKY